MERSKEIEEFFVQIKKHVTILCRWSVQSEIETHSNQWQDKFQLINCEQAAKKVHHQSQSRKVVWIDLQKGTKQTVKSQNTIHEWWEMAVG